MKLNGIVQGITNAAYAVDHGHRIICWNNAARELLGWKAEEVQGRLCHEVLCGRDDYGNVHCGERCSITRMAERKEPVHAFFLEVGSAGGGTRAVTVFVVPLPADQGISASLLHILAPVPAHSGARGHAGQPTIDPNQSPPGRAVRNADRAGGEPPLTKREFEVLRSVLRGLDTSHIGAEFGISPETVRVHVRNILHKLAAHTRLEAIVTAQRRGLI